MVAEKLAIQLPNRVSLFSACQSAMKVYNDEPTGDSSTSADLQPTMAWMGTMVVLPRSGSSHGLSSSMIGSFQYRTHEYQIKPIVRTSSRRV